jgi:hypothetical protein
VFGTPGFPLSDVPLQEIAQQVAAGRLKAKPPGCLASRRSAKRIALWRPMSDPAGASVRPLPIWIEQLDPGGVSCTTRNALARARSANLRARAAATAQHGAGSEDGAVADKIEHRVELFGFDDALGKIWPLQLDA